MAEKPTPAALTRAKTVLFESVKKGNVQPIVAIINHGFPIDEPIMDSGVNLLMHASALFPSEQLQTILELNPNVNARDNLGRTALHFACRAGNIDNFNILAAIEDIELDPATTTGVTPIMNAVESANIQLVAECLNNNLNPFMKDAIGRTALDYSYHYRDMMGQDMQNLIQTAMDQWMT